MSCYVNPDGTITCSDLDDTLASASKPKNAPQVPHVMGARVTAELLGARAGMNVVLLTDAEAATLRASLGSGT